MLSKVGKWKVRSVPATKNSKGHCWRFTGGPESALVLSSFSTICYSQIQIQASPDMNNLLLAMNSGSPGLSIGCCYTSEVLLTVDLDVVEPLWFAFQALHCGTDIDMTQLGEGGPGEIFEKCSGWLAVGIGHLRDVLASNWNFENKVCVTLTILKKYGRDCHCW